MREPNQPLALTIQGAAKAAALSRSTVYCLIADGRLDTRKAGRRVLITYDSLLHYLASLPKADIRTGRAGA